MKDIAKKRALVIVAHPDDETIWIGGTLLRLKDVKWTIFCLCRGDDPVRGPRFKKACEYYNAHGLISDLEDQGMLNIEKSLPEIKQRIIDNFAKEKFDYIFTHDYNGEYGHERHTAVHIAVKELVKEKIVPCEKLFFFAYKPDPNELVTNNIESSNFAFELTAEELAEKKGVIKEIYGFKKDSFESKLCLPKETFILSDL